MALVQCDITRFANHFFASDSLTVRSEARNKSGIDFCRVIGAWECGKPHSRFAQRSFLHTFADGRCRGRLCRQILTRFLLLQGLKICLNDRFNVFTDFWKKTWRF